MRIRAMMTTQVAGFLAVFMALIIGMPCHAEEGKNWRTEDTWRELLYTVPTVIDHFQTRDIIENPELYRDKNMILGRHPTQAKLNLFSAVAIGGHYLISRQLNHSDRKVWQYSTATVATLNIARNHFVIGLRVRY